MTEKIDISVIIPSYNSESSLDRVLRALRNQTDELLYEIILLDSSPGQTIDDIAAQYEEATFIKFSRQTSASIARNKGAGLAKGALLLFLDSDVILESDALHRANKLYQEKGYQIFGGSFTLDDSGGFDWSSFTEHCFFFSESLTSRPEYPRNNLPSGMLFIDRELFLEAGGFMNYPRLEDTEFSERLRKTGNTLHFVPSIVGSLYQKVSWIHLLKKAYINGLNIWPIRFATLSVSRRILYLASLPIMAFAKNARLIYRNFAYRNLAEFPRVTLAILPISICSLAWMIGSYQSLLLNAGISEKR